MTDRTLYVSATIHEQMGRESVLFWRRVMSWEGWPVVAKWLGLLVIILTYIPLSGWPFCRSASARFRACLIR